MKGTAVHPMMIGEQARLRGIDLAREAAATRSHPLIPRPAVTRAGFWFSIPPRERLQARIAGARLPQRIGLAFIALGLRLVDPDTQLERATRSAPEGA
ncbi:hypothetical protein [Euzebya sp.]|uniref:hypothetical protein n=1 Tax=Euzebya sp. TaxID=1971409 RepID=UPI003514530F